MVISVSNTIKQSPSCDKTVDNPIKIEEKVIGELRKLGISAEQVRWNEQGHLELLSPNNLKLHTFMLQMERLGLQMKLTKQTLIEID